MAESRLDELISTIRKQYVLAWRGIHGISHWRRVHENGLRLAELTGADLRVVELFAYLHDSKRINDDRDPGHGERAAQWAQTLQGSVIRLSDGGLEQLMYACTYHTDGLTEADVTVQTCWDADRLDLGRVGIQPEARYLCTRAARDPEMIRWALDRSQQGTSRS